MIKVLPFFLVSLIFPFVHVLGQDPVKVLKESTGPCTLRLAQIPIVGNLKIGSPFSEIKTAYPEIKPSTSNPNTYFTKSPYSQFSLLGFVFSETKFLKSFSLVYPDRTWPTIDTPFLNASETLKLALPRTTWTIWGEGEDRTISVECVDFAVVATLSMVAESREAGGPNQRFIFSVADKQLIWTGMSPSSRAVGNSPSVFPSEGSEYTIEFPNSPSISKSVTEVGEKIEAFYNHSKFGTLRAEYIELSPQIRKGLANSPTDQINALGLDAAKKLGLTGSEVSIENTNLGRTVTVRGFKTIDGVFCVVELVMHVGDRSMFSVITIGATRDVPDPTIVKFKASVRKRLR